MKVNIRGMMKKSWQYPSIAGQVTIWLTVLLGSILSATLIYLESVSSSYMTLMTYLLNGLALSAGGFIAGRKAGKDGWMQGLLQGLIYTGSLFVISLLAFDKTISTQFMIFAPVACLVTMLSGMAGVNTTKK